MMGVNSFQMHHCQLGHAESGKMVTGIHSNYTSRLLTFSLVI
jgi:hypothetical protein